MLNDGSEVFKFYRWLLSQWREEEVLQRDHR